MSDGLISLLQQPCRPRILLVGDVMLDRYLSGDVRRISPEAPIPILEVEQVEERLGGAGSVTSMLAALGAEVVLGTVIGDDAEGRTVLELLESDKVDTSCVVTDPKRVTTVKERLLGRTCRRYPHHMMRVDREKGEAVSDEEAEALLSRINACLAAIDLVVVSDYSKGVCAGEIVPRVVAAADAAGVRVVADPAKDVDYGRYAGCTCLTPNRLEAGRAVGMKIETPEDGLEAARRMLRFGVDAALVTLDQDGIAWVDGEGRAQLSPCRPRQVCDVTGAGDMVLSAVSYSLAAGADYRTAVEFANWAAGLEVERLGAVPLSRGELLAELRGENSRPEAAGKVLSVEEAVRRLAWHRRAGHRIVMTNGCFDLLHPGHVVSLQAARKQGDCLVVGLNSDRSVRELKGSQRPIIGQEGRAEILAALACVDYVVVFDEACVAGLVERLAPDMLVKSDDYSIEQVAGAQSVESRGGRVVLVPAKPGYSTTKLIGKLGSLGADTSNLPR